MGAPRRLRWAARGRLAQVVGDGVNHWQLSGVSAGSWGYSYSSNGSSKTLNRSPDYGARIIYVGAPGSGWSDNQYAQFNTAAVTGPTYGSVGLESGRNLLRGCPDKTVDLAIQRSIRMGGARQLQFRLDVFNAFNTVVINGRNTQIQYNSPTDLTVRNPQYLADGSLNPDRLTPRNSGFGAATSAQNMRHLQLQIRFQF